MRSLILATLILCALALSSCATINLDATSIQQHSVMMNQAGAKPYDVVANFELRDKAGWVIGFVPVNKPAGDHQDYFGTLLQSEIDKAGGDAVINVKIKAQYRVEDHLVNFLTAGIYQIRTVTVTGQVVKFK